VGGFPTIKFADERHRPKPSTSISKSVALTMQEDCAAAGMEAVKELLSVPQDNVKV
jgi:hypothetical protein